MNIYNIMHSMKHLDALEWFFSDDRGPVRKNGYFHTYWINTCKWRSSRPEPLADDRTSHPTSKGEDSHPSKKSHFVCLYLRPCSFGHDPHFMTIVESRNEDSSVDKKLCLLAQLSFRHNSVVKRMQSPLLMLWFSGWSPLYPPLTREQDPGILKLLHH